MPLVDLNLSDEDLAEYGIDKNQSELQVIFDYVDCTSSNGFGFHQTRPVETDRVPADPSVGIRAPYACGGFTVRLDLKNAYPSNPIDYERFAYKFVNAHKHDFQLAPEHIHPLVDVANIQINRDDVDNFQIVDGHFQFDVTYSVEINNYVIPLFELEAANA